MQQVKPGLEDDACTHVTIDGTLKALYMDLLCSNITLYTHYKVRDKCPHAHDTHIHRHLPIHLGGVDNHKDLLNGGGRSSLYQVFLYRSRDR